MRFFIFVGFGSDVIERHESEVRLVVSLNNKMKSSDFISSLPLYKIDLRLPLPKERESDLAEIVKLGIIF